MRSIIVLERSRRGNGRLALAVVLFLNAIAFTVFLFDRSHLPAAPSIVTYASEVQKPVAHIDPTPSASELPLVEHPILAGGIHTLDELVAATKKYPLLYRNFDPSTAQLLQLQRDLLVHSSYRIVGVILWTKHPIIIRAGTWVWRDASGRMVEMRCGNLLSVLLPGDPQPLIPPVDNPPMSAPVPLTIEPVMPVDTATISPEESFPTEGVFAENPPTFADNPPIYSCCFGIGGGDARNPGPGGQPPITPPGSPQPPTTTPEPGSLALLVTGIIAIGFKVGKA